jgi:phospholipid/cholesterol/gamma-HCH transport system substrate-binding protein
MELRRMSTEAKVGAFVLVSMVVMGITVYFVQTTQAVRGDTSFKTYFRYAGGLSPGALVLFGGIRVGEVSDVKPSHEDPTLIEVRFKVKRDTPLNEDSTASFGTLTFISTPALLITTGMNGARRLQSGETVRSEEAVSWDDVARVANTAVQSANALVTQLRQEIPPLTGQAATALANVNEITGPANQRQIAGILSELNTTLNRESARIVQMTDQISALAKHADSLVASARPVVSNMDRTVTNANRTLDAIREPFTKDLADLGVALQQTRSVLDALQNAVGAQKEDIVATIRNLRTASENVRAFTETLNERPWNLIRTTQPPDRKVPR